MPDAHPVTQHSEPVTQHSEPVTQHSEPVARDDRKSVVHQPKPVGRKSFVHNRVQIVMIHTSRYAFQGQARLAADAGVSRSTISRLLSGKISPTYRLARAVTEALERHLCHFLDMRDVFSTDGTYPNPSGCALCRCSGCLPEDAYNSHGSLRPAWKNAQPGDWSLAPAQDPHTAPPPF